MKKIIIVGAGIAGLTAGVYAKMSGFDVTIYESHSIAGGASTSWKRNGYYFEGGMHWLTGSSEKVAYNKIWREIGALDDDTPIYNRDPFSSLEYSTENGSKYACLYRDTEKLRAHLTEVSPEDSEEINRLCKDIKAFCKMNMPISDVKGVKVKNKSKLGLSSILAMLPIMGRMGFYSSLTSSEYANRFKSPVLQKIFKNTVGDENSAIGLIFTLSTLSCGDGGYPSGGSIGMATRIAKKFTSLGGKIEFNTSVQKVAVKNGVAIGVFIDGKEISADSVIVTLDTLVAIDTMFDKPIKEEWAEKMRKSTKPMLNTFICLGVKEDLSDLPENFAFDIDTPISCAGQKLSSIGLNNYASFKGYAPKGCTALTTAIMGDSYDWWKKQKQDGDYDAQKQKLAEAFIDALVKKYPRLEGKFEVWDVATPLTYERYLHSYKGSWMSIMSKGERAVAFPSKPETIKNVYFAGQRLMSPGGLPVAAETGRKAVQYVCLENDTVFCGNT